MLLRVVTLFSIALSFILVSCSPKHSEIVLAEFGDQEVTMGEFENVYAKNVGGVEKAKEDSLQKLQNFLDLYVNFKMKLRDAKVRGYDSNVEVNEELLDYKKKVGVSFILERQVVEPGIKELYDKRKTELRVSHIMIRPDSTGEENAQKLATQILDSIKAGKDFAEMVAKYTADVYSKSTGGDIYYITAGMLPAEFENAAYETGVGEVHPNPVKTNFGYHIIKVTDRRERVPEIRASHILVDFNNAEGQSDSAAARLRIDSVKAMIENGADFAELAKTYSEDTGSKENGGDLGFFQRRMMVKEFDEAAFNLNTGEVSKVLKTHYGYHIIKVTEKKPYPSLEESKEELKNLFKQNGYQQEYAKLVNNLKTKYNFALNESNLDVAAARTDTMKLDENINEAVNGIGDQPMFSYNGKTVSTGEFLKRALNSPDYKNKVANKTFYNEAVEKIAGEYLLEEEALNLEKTNPEFAQLMDDYRNGIYIFKLQDDEVWSKVKTDSVRLQEYYEKNKENYRWPDRINFSEIFTRKDSLAKDYYAQLKQGADFEELASKYTERPGYKEKKGNYGTVDPKTNKLYEEAAKLKPGEISEPYANGGGFSILKLNFEEQARLKTFSEAKAEVSGAFQEYESKRIEQEYLEKLRNRYKPVVYHEKLEEAYKTEE